MSVDETGRLEKGRDSSPREWDALRTNNPALPVEMSWHHTIPVLELRAVWNNMIDGKHWDTAKDYLSLVSVNNPGAAIAAIKNARQGGTDLPSEIRDELAMKLVWQGYNIVEGPGKDNRLEGDDPKSSYEMWSMRSVKGKDRSRLSDIDAVYQSFAKNNGLTPYADNRTLIESGRLKVPTKEQARNLRSTIRTYSPTLKGKDPIPYTESMWEPYRRGRPNWTDVETDRGVVERKPRGWSVFPVYRRKR
jgi:hypothetical protein